MLLKYLWRTLGRRALTVLQIGRVRWILQMWKQCDYCPLDDHIRHVFCEWRLNKGWSVRGLWNYNMQKLHFKSQATTVQANLRYTKNSVMDKETIELWSSTGARWRFSVRHPFIIISNCFAESWWWKQTSIIFLQIFRGIPQPPFALESTFSQSCTYTYQHT